MSQLGGKMYPSQQQSSQSGASSQQQQFQMQLQQHPLEQWNQALMHQALLQQHQQALFHPGLLAAMSQIEPIASGNLPPGFDAASCRSVYVGNIHPKVSEALLAEVFASMGQLEGYKLIKKEKSSYGFVDYYDHRSAAAAILNLNGRQIFGQSIKVNWAYASGQREDTTGHYNIFVGDLSPEVTDAVLHSAFSVYRCCSDARVMWDQRTGRSRGFGFVSFRTKQEAEKAINEMSGKWLGSRAIRCNWATKNSDIQGDNVQSSTNTLGSTAEESSFAPPVAKHEVLGEQQHDDEGDGPESNPQYTTVYVGNLAHEATQADLHCQFHALGVGIIEEVKVQKEKGFGFVRYRTHEEAAYAIQAANGRVICGKPIKCSWGSKPTPAGTNSSPLPPPQLSAMSFQNIVAAGLNSGISPAELLACQRQLGFAAGDALLPLPQQSAQAIPLGNAAAARAIFESLQPNAVAAAMGQQHLFY